MSAPDPEQPALAYVPMTTGQRIEFLLRARSITPESLAERIRVSRMQMYRYRRDQSAIPLRVAARIADELGSTTDFLSGRRPRPEPPDGAPTA